MEPAAPQLPRQRFSFHRFTVWVRKPPPAELRPRQPGERVREPRLARAGDGDPRGRPRPRGACAGSIPRVHLCSDSRAHMRVRTRTPSSHLPHPPANPQRQQSIGRAPKALVFPSNRLGAWSKMEKRRDLGFEANK